MIIHLVFGTVSGAHQSLYGLFVPYLVLLIYCITLVIICYFLTIYSFVSIIFGRIHKSVNLTNCVWNTYNFSSLTSLDLTCGETKEQKGIIPITAGRLAFFFKP